MTTAETNLGERASRSRLWLWFVLAFALQCAAWAAWFVVAARHPVREVPLVAVPSSR